MADKSGIIWAAARVTSATEQRLLAELAQTGEVIVRTIPIPSLAREIVPALIQGPVIVIVSSRKDAATALSFGADEVVRVTRSVTLRKSTVDAAIVRARSRAQARIASSPALAATEECPGLALLLRILERGLGNRPDAAAVRCSELADELARVVAMADRLMQRVRIGAERDELKGWFSEVRDYARATLKAEALASALQDEVQRTGAVVKLLGDLSIGTAHSDVDVTSLLSQLADFVRGDVAPDVSIDVSGSEPCIVRAPRQALIGIVCAVLEIALDNIFVQGHVGCLTLRASKTNSAIVIEIVDDGVLGSTDLRASIVDPFLANARTTRLRRVRDRARALGGELIADGDETGNIVSIYLPESPELTKASPLDHPHPRISARTQ
jgi:anti-sigma regulatory factor (Ser/Thr protein kinase)